MRLVVFARQQTMNEEAHPVPSGVLAWQMEKFAGLIRSQSAGMEKEFAFAHVVLR
jgi:hypothetical protein